MVRTADSGGLRGLRWAASRRSPVLAVLIAGFALASVAAAAGDPVPAGGDEERKDPKAGQERPLRFTDEDLEKYHRPAPPAGETEEGEGAPAPGAAEAAGAGKAAAAAKAAPTTLEPVPRPPGAAPGSTVPSRAGRAVPAAPTTTIARPPSEDPLKPWRDREALEAFREDQMRSLRERISTLQSRLDYLNLKRLSILDPTRIMPMPQIEEDRTADRGKGSQELLRVVDAQIEAATGELQEAKDNLIAIQTRFARETGRP